MPGIDALLFVRSLVYDMGHQLMVVEPERHGMGRFAAERAAQLVDVEPLVCIDIVNRKGQMKQDTAHLQRPLTIGFADPSHQPAAMCGVTCAIENRPYPVITNVPAAPSIRETSCRRMVAAASLGLRPPASCS